MTAVWETYEVAMKDLLEALDSTGADYEHDVTLDGPDGPRQFDIVIRHRVGSFEFLTLVECKNHRRKITVSAVEGFAAKIRTFNASKGVIIASSGFSSGARTFAKREGIELRRGLTSGEDLASIGVEIPVIVEEILLLETNFRPKLTLAPGQTLHLSMPMEVNGRDVEEFIRSDCAARLTSGSLPSGWVDIDFSGQLPGELCSGDEAFPVTAIECRTHAQRSVFFGYLGDEESTAALLDEVSGNADVVFQPDEILVNYRRSFAPYEEAKEVPVRAAIQLRVVASPTITHARGSVESVAVDDSSGCQNPEHPSDCPGLDHDLDAFSMDGED